MLWFDPAMLRVNTVQALIKHLAADGMNLAKTTLTSTAFKTFDERVGVNLFQTLH